MTSISDHISQILTKYKFASIVSKDTLYDIVNLSHRLTQDYDTSHDIYHHLSVYKNCLDILNTYSYHPKFALIVKLVTVASLLHDTVDHKYPDSISKYEKVVDFLLDNFGIFNADNIVWVINNISYSKEISGGYPIAENTTLQLVRNIVSDADKIDALGKIGIERCYAYNKSKNPDATPGEVTKIVIKHCHEKLLALREYIRTPVGRNLSYEPNKYIEEYVRINSCGSTCGEKCRFTYPNHVPIVVTYTPENTVHKFILNEELQVLFVLNKIREIHSLNQSESLFAMIGNKSVNVTDRFKNLYDTKKNTLDDLLYVHIFKENTFGEKI